MAARKARTAAQKDRASDLRLQSKYGITLADRCAREAEQGGKCAICGGPLDPPCVDHFHCKIVVRDSGDVWEAEALNEQGIPILRRTGENKLQTTREARQQSIPLSIRGLLCRRCNHGLGFVERWFDAARNPGILLNLHHYFVKRLLDIRNQIRVK